MTGLITLRRCLIFLAGGIGVYLLHWAEDLLMPLVLSLLLADVLSPVVRLLRRWRFRNAVAVTLVTLTSGALVLGAMVLISAQVFEFTAQLPDYRDNILTKVQALRRSAGGPFSRLTGTFREVGEALNPGSTTVPSIGGTPTTAPTSKPLPVEIVAPKTQTTTLATGLLGPMLAPLAKAGMVFTLLYFFLLESDLIGHRIGWLLRQGDVGISRHSIEDASARVGRYLRTQLLVNLSYGVVVAIALSLLGLPSALLLAAIAAALRYVPYVGPLVGVSLPSVLAIAVFPQWFWPLMVLAVVLSIELLTSTILEPLLYGSSTGVSSSGVVIAIFFWGWVWGPMGLILAMPITVWIVIVGRYLPSLRWLSVLLSADQIATIEKEDTLDNQQLEEDMEGWAE